MHWFVWIKGADGIDILSCPPLPRILRQKTCFVFFSLACYKQYQDGY